LLKQAIYGAERLSSRVTCFKNKEITMPVTKPLQILGGAGTPVVRRARQSALERSRAVNAALGLDNVARLRNQEPQTAADAAKNRQSGMPREMNAKPAFSGVDLGLGSMADTRKFLEMTRAQRALQLSENPLALVNSLNSLQSARPEGREAAVLALRANSHKARNAPESEKAAENTAGDAGDKTGLISALFESGKDGIAAVGYDRMGGTSYGRYQIASKTGTMDRFISFLSEKAADFAERLKKAGAADTGSKEGQMPGVWKELAAEEPGRFAALQQEFISKTHFEPVLAKIKELTGLEPGSLSAGVREAIFSTAVQHGPGGAGRIIARALESAGPDKLASENREEALEAERNLVRDIYRNRSGRFASSGNQVREAVQARLNTEMNMVLDLLRQNDGARLG
jgi:hypothetical protein